MTITLARVDDRVIHGQTTTRWTKVRRVQGILVVSNDVAKDELRKKVLKAAAGNLKLGIYNIEQGVESVPKGMASNKDFFLISDSPQSFAKLLELGVDFGKTLNIGPMNSREGAKVLGRSVAIDQKDYEAFEYMDDKGINIEFQLLPDDERKSWEIMKSKFNAN
ncbi:PTS system mannose/fructose/N-acetylgalactosamine-transporter subunit IIB [Oceanobacillus jeddahense]|uniref:PTS sugar transporter subunit IIB n=1 Tax=Oceanobacillus jeddahense TaxID=1462527 RepID=A0ABY5JTI6_9BACI|nr:PTS sugar transporter subunit IIB [Oceanobacillus jeddahense]UUI02498.1 PTS sugar transporter subunit IIB [Oceanobacillus jeddahense]